MAGFRVGFGYDSHRFEAGRRLVLCGIEIEGETDEIVSIVKGAGYKYAAAIKKKMRPVETDLFRIHRQIIPRGMPTWKAVLLATRGKWKL